MQPIDLTNVTSVILSTPYDKSIEVSVEVIKTIFEIGLDIRDKILALKHDGDKEALTLQSKNEKLLQSNKVLREVLQLFIEDDKESGWGYNPEHIDKAKTALEQTKP